MYAQLLPLFLTVPLLPAVIRESFGALTKPGVLLAEGDSDLSPGVLEALLLREPDVPQQLHRVQQQRFAAADLYSSSSSSSSSSRMLLKYKLEDELWGSYFVLLSSDSSSSSSSKRHSTSPWAAFDCESAADSSNSSSSSSNNNEELQQRRQLLEEHPFLFLFYCALRHEAKRRGDLRTAVAASWLLTYERSAAGGFNSQH